MTIGAALHKSHAARPRAPRPRAFARRSRRGRLARDLDVVDRQSSSVGPVARPEEEADPPDLRQVRRARARAPAVVREVAEPDADRLELVLPARAGAAVARRVRERALVRLLDPAPVGADADPAPPGAGSRS